VYRLDCAARIYQTLNFYRDRPKSGMDPLSELLLILYSKRSVFAGLKAGGAWAIDFPPPDGIKFNAIITGQCWLQVDGLAAISLMAGDGFLLSHPQRFSLCSDLQLPAIPADEIYRHAPVWQWRWIFFDWRWFCLC
jgi:hypothetical protein